MSEALSKPAEQRALPYMAGIKSPAGHPVKRLLLVTLGAALMAFNINTFVYAGA